MLNINPQDVNRLRELLASGQINEADLSGMQIQGGSYNPQGVPLSAQERFAQGDRTGALPMNSMRNESTGQVTYFGQGGGFSDKPYAQAANAQQPRRKVRVVGVGDGNVTELGEEDERALPIDYTRPGINMPGIGRGHYTADGRYAVVDNPDGSRTKVVLGYDAEGSDRLNARALARRKVATDIAATEESIASSQQARNRKDQLTQIAQGAGVVPQKTLEDLYGKADKGMRWRSDGTQEPLPGGEVEGQARAGVDKAADAMRVIDQMIGQRDAKGNLVGGSQTHPGFEAAVGAGFGKTFGSQTDLFPIPTAGRDFRKLLEQSKGGAFLQAFETLKGGGQITEVEGRKATAAVTRMDAAQSEQEFIAAAREFRDAVEAGMKKLGQRAGGQMQPATAAPSSGAPRVGEMRQGYVYTGGDPASQSSWRKVQ